MAASEGGSGGLTEYIKHHLTHLTVNQDHGAFWAFHLDSVLFTGVLAALFIVFFGIAARRATSGVPGKLQAAFEILVEMVDGTVKETFHGKSKLIAPLAITIFALVFLMNFMDLIPVDFLPWAAKGLGVGHLRVVATADINTTLGMSITVFLLIWYVGISEKGVLGFFGEWLSAPFHAHGAVGRILTAFPNLLLRVIEELVRPLSLSLRLFGNMYAGELDFRVDRGTDAGIVLRPSIDLRLGRHPADRRHRVDAVPYLDHHAASIHFRHADHRVPEHGRRKTLTLPLTLRPWRHRWRTHP